MFCDVGMSLGNLRNRARISKDHISIIDNPFGFIQRPANSKSSMLFKWLLIVWYSPILSFENARAQRAFAGDEHYKMRAGRARFLAWEPGAQKRED